MRITQGTFSYLPDLSDAEIEAQVAYCLREGFAVSIEVSDDPHPRNVYWEMWAQPMFDLVEPGPVMAALTECRRAFPQHYVKLGGYDSRLGRQTTALSFLVQRPSHEPAFVVERSERADRRIEYRIRSYAAERPAGARTTNGAEEP